jgi:hypothetical protein
VPGGDAVASPAGAGLDDALALWANGDQAAAAEVFLAIDWSHPAFAKDSIFRMKETEFVALPIAERQRVTSEILIPKVRAWGGLNRYVRDTARSAASSGKVSEARSSFQQMKACGEFFLANPDALALVRAVGKDLVGGAAGELDKLH